MLADTLEPDRHSVEEDIAQARALAVVVGRRFVHLEVGVLMHVEAQAHLRRARALAMASSAGIVWAVPASISALRRSASSSHSCSISASDNVSRLFRSS